MINQHFYKSRYSLKDKILALDFYLIFLILLLGIISFFAMYSSEQGGLGYYTEGHIYRFFIFFVLFLVGSLFRMHFWFKLGYIFYFIVLVLLGSLIDVILTMNSISFWLNVLVWRRYKK